MKAVSGYREFDLTTCETCGMWWTAAKHELCPRCALAETKERCEQILHELEMIELDRMRAAEAR